MDVLAPWHIVILLVVILVLFGAKRLPGAADSLGKSMHIFKKSVAGLHDEPPTTDAAKATPTAALPVTPQPLPARTLPGQTPATDPPQQQILDLQRQIQELQHQPAGGSSSSSTAVNGAAPLSEAQRNQQSF